MTAKEKSKNLSKAARKKRGVTYLVLAAVCLVVSILLPPTNTLGSKESVMIVSFVGAVAAGCLLIGLLGGLYYLITGFTKKE